MRRPGLTLLNAATILSLLLLVTTAACWLTGALRERHATVWRVHARPERTFFVRLDRQQLIVSDQAMVPVRMPPGYVVDSTRFREFRVFGPGFPNGAAVSFGNESPILTPAGAGFRRVRTPIGGINYDDRVTHTTWQARGFYGSVEIPWWSLLLLFALLPAASWTARHRRRANARRGLCPTCGYDLRATPDRCPECGAAAQSAATVAV